MHVSNKYTPFGRGRGKWACWPYTYGALAISIDIHSHPFYYHDHVAKLMALRDRLYDDDGRPRIYATYSRWFGAHQKLNGAWHSGNRMRFRRRRANRRHRATERTLIRKMLASGQDTMDSFKISDGYWD